jgi:hypothetical protein
VKHTIPGEEENVYIGWKKEETTQKPTFDPALTMFGAILSLSLRYRLIL